MQTQLSQAHREEPRGQEAEAILRRCVHCGFCLATCPTYQVLGDELDSPRGRIYLIKQLLEGAPGTREAQLHLDRCLTCRSCETTCPSGVQYGQLVEIGREILQEQGLRPKGQRLLRALLAAGLTSPWFGAAVRLGRLAAPLLPGGLRDKLPPASPVAERVRPAPRHRRRVILLAGCVQPALLPNINQATARVLDKAGFQTLIPGAAGCCGALRAHLDDLVGARRDARGNIDAWWPAIEGSDGGAPVEAIVSNASACGLSAKEYGRLFAGDPVYKARAQRVSGLAVDLAEFVQRHADRLQARPASDEGKAPRLALHVPCTLQHGQALPNVLPDLLARLGFAFVASPAEAHLCCGSAGTYSLLQPELSTLLRDRKLGHLRACGPDYIVSANVGCILHLQAGTHLPVRHWVEILDDHLTEDKTNASMESRNEVMKAS